MKDILITCAVILAFMAIWACPVHKYTDTGPVLSSQEYCDSVEWTTDYCLDNSQGLWKPYTND